MLENQTQNHTKRLHHAQGGFIPEILGWLNARLVIMAEKSINAISDINRLKESHMSISMMKKPPKFNMHL